MPLKIGRTWHNWRREKRSKFKLILTCSKYTRTFEDMRVWCVCDALSTGTRSCVTHKSNLSQSTWYWRSWMALEFIECLRSSSSNVSTFDDSKWISRQMEYQKLNRKMWSRRQRRTTKQSTETAVPVFTMLHAQSGIPRVYVWEFVCVRDVKNRIICDSSTPTVIYVIWNTKFNLSPANQTPKR